MRRRWRGRERRLRLRRSEVAFVLFSCAEISATIRFDTQRLMFCFHDNLSSIAVVSAIVL
jgi:hypothetical protein